MTSITTTPSRALQVLISNNCDIPTPNLLATGSNTSESENGLIDSNAEFIKDGVNLVNIGDVLYCYAIEKAATVIEVVNETTLKLNSDVFGAETSIEYFIYQQSPLTGAQNEGCLLYVKATAPGEAKIDITTAGNDRVVLLGISSGVLPVKVKKLWKENTDAVDGLSLIALW